MQTQPDTTNANEGGELALGLEAGAARTRPVAVGAVTLALAAMTVDHLLGDDPGLEDPPMFLISSALSIALAALVFGRIVPRAVAAHRASRDGLILGAVAVVPGLATLWLGLPFVLAGGALALGLQAREAEPSVRATAATALGALVMLGAAGGYASLAIDKLG